MRESAVKLAHTLAQNLGVLYVTVVVNLLYRRAGDYVVELIAENRVPALVDESSRILCGGLAQKRCVGNRRRLECLIQKLALAVVLLVLRDGGVCASVHLEVKLAAAFRLKAKLVYALVEFFFYLVYRLAGKAYLGFRKSRESVLNAVVLFKHIRRGSAAAVAVAEGLNLYVGVLFRFVTVPKIL